MGGTAPVLLDPGKEILHQVAPLVGFLVVGPLVFTAGPWGMTAIAPRASNAVSNQSLSNALPASRTSKGALLLSGAPLLLWWVCPGSRRKHRECPARPPVPPSLCPTTTPPPGQPLLSTGPSSKRRYLCCPPGLRLSSGANGENCGWVPQPGSKSRQGAPVRILQKTASRNGRLSRAVMP